MLWLRCATAVPWMAIEEQGQIGASAYLNLRIFKCLLLCFQVFSLDAWLCSMWGQNKYWITWDCIYRCLWVWVLGTQHGSFTRATSVFNYSTTSAYKLDMKTMMILLECFYQWHFNFIDKSFDLYFPSDWGINSSVDWMKTW